MEYDNLNKKNEIVHNTNDKKYEKRELFDLFSSFISVNGYKLIGDIDGKTSPYVLNISNDINNYKLIIYYKNITGAGWNDKPHIKRVQVTNVRNDDINKYISTSSNETFLILGYYNYDDNPIMVAWNAYNYVYHNTTRSCYIDIESLKEGYEKGFISKYYSNQKVWIFTADYFEKFLQEYINSNKVNR